MSRANRQQTLKCSQVVLYGRYEELKTSFTKANLFAKNRGGRTTCLIISPDATDTDLRFAILEKYLPNSVVNTQGIVLEESGQAAIVESRDSPTLVIEHLGTGKVGVLHAGRDQLINHDHCCIKTGVIERIIPDLGPLDGKQLNVYITGGISAEYFGHNSPQYVTPFIEFFGPEVVPDRSKMTLDIVGVIKAILKKFGVPETNIHHDGLCTYSTPWLASRRAKKDGTNWTLVVKH